jgi:ADP-heptose:LPS heptosyltransferase
MMLVFLPNGIGDSLMLVPALRRLIAVRGVDGVVVVVASALHQRLLRAFVDPAVRTFERHDGGRFAHVRLFWRMWTSGAASIAAPMLSRGLLHRLFFLFMFRRTLVPSSFVGRSVLGLRPARFALKTFDGHQVNYFVQFLAELEPRMDTSRVAPHELAPAARSGAPDSAAALGLQADDAKRRVVIGISCGELERHKIPSPQSFASLVNALARRADIELLVVGSPGDRAMIDVLRSALDPAVPVVESIGLPIEDLVRTMSACHLGISGTTGQGHMMAAAGLPMLIVSGVTSPQESGPYVERGAILRHRYACGPCYQDDYRLGCRLVRCMETLDVEQGAVLAQRLLHDVRYGVGWMTRTGKTHPVPVKVIDKLHELPPELWILPQEN